MTTEDSLCKDKPRCQLCQTNCTVTLYWLHLLLRKALNPHSTQ